ncbi:MAG: hypothetical protein B6D55_00255 [Candidatus Omnitrophica bacterium 4484_70.2]|nr:MAG: hypothetical protein B6D55_00255 [Candidatus Omnitrophica bacterium 4484_70.2]
MKKFELIEHTADIGVRVYAEDLKELFKNSAQALISLLVNEKKEGRKEKAIKLEAESLEELLVNWLNELISLFFAEKFLFCSCDLEIKENKPLKTLEAKIKGIDFDPYSNKINMEIKAATYHNLKIKKKQDKLEVDIIFDI